MVAASITFYSLVVAVHVIAVVVAFGVTFTYPLIVPLTKRTAPRNMPWLHRMQVAIGQRIIAPVGGLILLAGIYLALKSPVYDFSDWWVGVGLVVIVVLLAMGGMFFSPNEAKLAELAERDIAASGDGEPAFSPEYEALLSRVGMVGALSSLSVLVAIVVMVLGARGSFL
jgi:uncharacterized membrane protein